MTTARFFDQSSSELKKRLEEFLDAPSMDNASWLLLGINEHLTLTAQLKGTHYVHGWTRQHHLSV